MPRPLHLCVAGAGRPSCRWGRPTAANYPCVGLFGRTQLPAPSQGCRVCAHAAHALRNDVHTSAHQTRADHYSLRQTGCRQHGHRQDYCVLHRQPHYLPASIGSRAELRWRTSMGGHARLGGARGRVGGGAGPAGWVRCMCRPHCIAIASPRRALCGPARHVVAGNQPRLRSITPIVALQVGTLTTGMVRDRLELPRIERSGCRLDVMGTVGGKRMQRINVSVGSPLERMRMLNVSVDAAGCKSESKSPECDRALHEMLNKMVVLLHVIMSSTPNKVMSACRRDDALALTAQRLNGGRNASQVGPRIQCRYP